MRSVAGLCELCEGVFYNPHLHYSVGEGPQGASLAPKCRSWLLRFKGNRMADKLTTCRIKLANGDFHDVEADEWKADSFALILSIKGLVVGFFPTPQVIR